ncbi:OmpA family protein [Aestuariivirga litoralis]|uniref:OmpA family protein n=1 Tax=Aestuariivirga litoralis TaxID=2650924 RepID=UPI0018C62C14|nr:OmpA family protein [Aestuariivirga litoralis]MBG1231982.1 OmpA family protein [Aestuariivirga litoralis]
MKKPVLAVLAAALLLSACTTDPFTGEQKASNTAVGGLGGAGIGAITGAVIGAAVSADVRKAALIGAGIGALTGGGIGLYMDNQEAKLRQRLQGTGVSVTRVGDSIVLNMPSNITFDTDKSELKPQFYNTLNSVVLVFKEYKQTLINVIGHTDSSGDPNYNYDLSRRRAASVAQYLSAQQLDPNRFSVEGHGAGDPIASNASPSGRAQNRRVEITILPLT